MSGERIPVARPRLPATDRLIPYLEMIDRSRSYSNFGALTRLFAQRLALLFDVPEGGVVPVGNATIGLTAALLELARPGKPLCLVPSWTFCASAHAIMAAGLEPYFVDVHPATWQIGPAQIEALPPELLDQVAAVMPVGAFGAPVDIQSWDAFWHRTGIPAVIDAAAGFDSLVPGELPALVSLHATKSLGIGEGGFLATTNLALAEAVLRRINFGFHASRRAHVAATNGKLSEYACAIGLAGLDVWEDTRANWANLRDSFRERLAHAAPAWFSGAVDQDWVTATFVVAIAAPVAEATAAMDQAGIDTRRWWEAGCHCEHAFRHCGSTQLPVTEHLARHSIGLPFFPDLSLSQIDRIVVAISPYLGSEGCAPFSAYPMSPASNGGKP